MPLNHSLSLIKTTLKEAKIWSKVHRREEKQTTQRRMDQCLFYFVELKQAVLLSAVSSHPTAAGKQRHEKMWRERGTFLYWGVREVCPDILGKAWEKKQRNEKRERWGWGGCWSVVKCEGFQECQPMHFSGKVFAARVCTRIFFQYFYLNAARMAKW